MIKKYMNIILFILLIIIIGVLFYFLLSNKKVDITSISLNEHNIYLNIGDKWSLAVSVLPENASDKTVEWISDNPDIAIVSNDGNVTAVGSGETFITVRSKDGNFFDKCLVKVAEVIIEKTISIKEKTIEIKKGTTIELNVFVDPSQYIDSVIWTSSDNNIVTVDKGVITAVNGGTATIKATLDDKVVSCQVTVTIPVDSIKLNKSKISLKKGYKDSIKATISPSDSTNKTITWSSSDSSIVKVDSDGIVTGVGSGTATITATIENKQATCKVTSIGYVITADSRFLKDPTVASYNSETLKYRITQVNNNNYVLVWVLDAYKQFNSALPKVGTAYSGDDILRMEVSRYGYQKKGLVATNGGFFWDGWGDSPCSPFIINKGIIVRDIENKKYSKKIYGVLGMTKNSEFKLYSFTSNNYSKNVSTRKTMLNDGVRNSFTTTGTVLTPTSMSTSNDQKYNRTVLCQVDRNNYVIYSGGELTFYQIAKTLKNNYSCKIAYNFDGGGSRKLYYKTNSMSEARKVFGGGRAIPDMMYFVEQ